MAFWLVKSEPGCWSFADHLAKGVEPWTGVRNHQAAAHLKAMRVGDRAFFYHSVDEKRIVGILEVVGEAVPDPTDPAGRFVSVDFKAIEAVPRPVTLAEMKAEPRLGHLALLKQSRLSVVSIDAEAWGVLCGMAGLDSVAQSA